MTVEVEMPLSGGGVTEGVVRVGDTVRRPYGAHSAAVHGVLRHLEAVGFDGVPRVLGVDEHGREVLSWVDGEVPGRPLPEYAVSEGVLGELGVLLRRYHDAVASYGVRGGFERLGAKGDGAPELVGHCDVAPGNVVFRDEKPVGLIDFDLARPTTRLFDVVTTLRHWAPIADPADRDWRLCGADVGKRARLFCDAYGLDRDRRREVLPAARVRFERSYEAMRRAAEGGGAWRRIWDGGAGARIRRAQDWLECHWEELDARLA